MAQENQLALPPHVSPTHGKGLLLLEPGGVWADGQVPNLSLEPWDSNSAVTACSGQPRCDTASTDHRLVITSHLGWPLGICATDSGRACRVPWVCVRLVLLVGISNTGTLRHRGSRVNLAAQLHWCQRPQAQLPQPDLFDSLLLLREGLVDGGDRGGFTHFCNLVVARLSVISLTHSGDNMTATAGAHQRLVV